MKKKIKKLIESAKRQPILLYWREHILIRTSRFLEKKKGKEEKEA